MTYVVIGAVSLAALYGAHRLALLMERAGWLYYRERRATSGTLGNAFLELQSCLEPGARHVLEERAGDMGDAEAEGEPFLPGGDEPTLDAGGFADWLRHIRGVLTGDGTAAVPCGDCVACCASSQFVHIAPDEHDARAQIPPALLVPAPRMPEGHVLMGYDQDGRCPMLGAEGCSIYRHRPRTCRRYDCRVFAATGIDPDQPAFWAIAFRVDRWRFTFETRADRVWLEAVQRATRFLRSRGDSLPDDVRPATAALTAVLAVVVCDLWVEISGGTVTLQVSPPDVDSVVAAARSRGRTRAGGGMQYT